jgi:VWFA-related protein
MALLIMLLLGSGLFAQEKPAQEKPAQEKPAKEEPVTIFRAEVSLVKVDFEVVDRGGGAAPDFTKDDFVVFDENQPQPIVHFERQSVPLDLLLLLDISGSMRRSLEDVAAASRAALAQLHPGDRVALMLFSRETKVAQPFTEDFSATQYKILDSIYKQNLGNGTLINESLIAAAGYMKQEPVRGRRAILIVTDNEGLNYKSPDAEVVRTMFAADTVLNAIVVRKGPRPPAVRSTGYTNPDFAPPDVYRISQQTGGAAVDGIGKVGDVFQRMVESIRSRYFLQYAAPSAELEGKFRHIRVELSPAARRLHPGAVIHAREGYYASDTH